MEAAITAPKAGTVEPHRRIGDRAGRGWRPTGGGQLTRIVAGALGGRRIAVPPRGTRPTTDRVRESLFNVLAARMDLHGASVLDLYAGSGALGLEALSRGAATAMFVESDQRAAAVIGQNIKTLGGHGSDAAPRHRRVGAGGGRRDSRRPGIRRSALRHGRGRGERDAHRADRSRLDRRGQRRGRRARRVRARSWPGRTAGSRGKRRRYGDTRLEMAERTDLSCPASVVTHERRGMPGILRPGDPRPHRHLRARGRPVRRGRGGRAGQPQQEGHVRSRRAHRDDRGVDGASAEPAGGVAARASSSTS